MSKCLSPRRGSSVLAALTSFIQMKFNDYYYFHVHMRRTFQRDHNFLLKNSKLLRTQLLTFGFRCKAFENQNQNISFRNSVVSIANCDVRYCAVCSSHSENSVVLRCVNDKRKILKRVKLLSDAAMVYIAHDDVAEDDVEIEWSAFCWHCLRSRHSVQFRLITATNTIDFTACSHTKSGNHNQQRPRDEWRTEWKEWMSSESVQTS